MPTTRRSDSVASFATRTYGIAGEQRILEHEARPRRIRERDLGGTRLSGIACIVQHDPGRRYRPHDREYGETGDRRRRPPHLDEPPRGEHRERAECEVVVEGPEGTRQVELDGVDDAPPREVAHDQRRDHPDQQPDARVASLPDDDEDREQQQDRCRDHETGEGGERVPHPSERTPDRVVHLPLAAASRDNERRAPPEPEPVDRTADTERQLPGRAHHDRVERREQQRGRQRAGDSQARLAGRADRCRAIRTRRTRAPATRRAARRRADGTPRSRGADPRRPRPGPFGARAARTIAAAAARPSTKDSWYPRSVADWIQVNGETATTAAAMIATRRRSRSCHANAYVATTPAAASSARNGSVEPSTRRATWRSARARPAGT